MSVKSLGPVEALPREAPAISLSVLPVPPMTRMVLLRRSCLELASPNRDDSWPMRSTTYPMV
jgi:hypothetical protein